MEQTKQKSPLAHAGAGRALNYYQQRNYTKDAFVAPSRERSSVNSKRKIQINPPKNATLLFCTFDKPISDYINNVGGYCAFLHSRHIDAYNLEFCTDKEVWIFHLGIEANPLDLRFAYALLRHGAIKIQILCFPLGGRQYV